MRSVSIVGIHQLPVQNSSPKSLRRLGAEAVTGAMADAGVTSVDALFAGNMLADELQGQKHIAALIADEAGLHGIEALQVRAATASGAAALRMAYYAVASGEANLAVAVGVEKMSSGLATPALTKALDAEREVPDGATLISQNAVIMRRYFEQYQPPEDALFRFSINAHRNARHNPNALFKSKAINPRAIRNSRMVSAPIRLFDCAPICDGAAAVILAPSEEARAYTPMPVKILASSVATDRFRIEDRADGLWLSAVEASAHRAFRQANVHREDIDFFELHDAFSIIACLTLEAVGYAARGAGWRLAAENQIALNGAVPISVMGGLKARGHPIGATALYQACEVVLQLTGRGGKNQINNARLGMMQSIGGVGTTVITHILSG